jgi:predicted nucleic acid-binding protein
VTAYLCDTNVVSEIMRLEPGPAVLRWFTSMKGIALSVVTVEELAFRLRRKGLYEKEAWLRRFVQAAVRVLPVEAEDAFLAGEKRGQLRPGASSYTRADALIAAAAWRRGLVLATRNVRDFSEVASRCSTPGSAEPPHPAHPPLPVFSERGTPILSGRSPDQGSPASG